MQLFCVSGSSQILKLSTGMQHPVSLISVSSSSTSQPLWLTEFFIEDACKVLNISAEAFMLLTSGLEREKALVVLSEAMADAEIGQDEPCKVLNATTLDGEQDLEIS